MDMKTARHYELADTILRMNKLARDYTKLHFEIDPNNSKVTKLGEELEKISLKFVKLLEERKDDN